MTGEGGSAAIREALGLLRLQSGAQPERVEPGYLDLLGAEDAIGDHPGQQVFHRKMVPAIYERWWRPVVARFLYGRSGVKSAEEHQIALDLLEISPGDRVLDVGCGPGNFTRDFADAAGDGLVVGIDASAAMIAAGTKRGGGDNLVYIRGDACSLPFDDEEFDAVCCIGVIHLLDDPMKSLAEQVRVLAPGGRLAMMATCNPEGDRQSPRAGVVVFGRDELSDALAEHGMERIEQRMMRRAQFLSARKPAA